MIRGPSSNKPKRKRSRERAVINMSRVSAEIKLEDTNEILDCRVFLNDLSPVGVGLFVDMQLDKGKQISLVIEEPKNLYVKGEVVWCTPYTLDTKIITAEVFRYRVGVKFLFDSPEEQDALKKYCDELYTKITDSGSAADSPLIQPTKKTASK